MKLKKFPKHVFPNLSLESQMKETTIKMIVTGVHICYYIITRYNLETCQYVLCLKNIGLHKL